MKTTRIEKVLEYINKEARDPDYVDLPDEYSGPIPYDIIFVKGADVDNFWEEIWSVFSLDEVKKVESDDTQEELIWYVDVDQHAENEFKAFMEEQKAKGVVKYYETSPIEEEYDMKVWGKKAQKEDVDESDMRVMTYDDLDEFAEEPAGGDAKEFVDADDAEEARALGEELGVDWDSVDFTPEDLLIGMGVELEHGTPNPETNVTDDDIEMTALIALSHLNEDPKYYNKLVKMEKQGQLGGSKRIAVSELESAIDSIIDVDTVLNTVSTKGWNQQMKNMFNEVYSELWDRMKFDADTQEALVRLLDVVKNAGSYQPDLITNILAKAQHALGLKTPIMF